MKQNNDRARLFMGAAAVILSIALVAGGAVFLEKRRKAEDEELARMSEESRPGKWTNENTVFLNDKTYGFDHRIETFLFIGTDNTGNGSSGGADYIGSMADFILLMVLDYTDDSCGCIQIDRNTITPVRMIGRDGSLVGIPDLQICTAHWYGGSPEESAENTVYAVKEFLGELENVDGWFVMNMQDIAYLNSAVGGVEVTIGQDLTAADPAFKEGSTIVLDDAQAERFVRARMVLADDSNVARMGRQKQYMEGVLRRIRQNTASNPKYGADLWKLLREHSLSNMSGNAFSRIAQMYLRGEDKGILKIDGRTGMGKRLDDGEIHEEFYADKASVVDVMTNLFSLVPVDDQ